ncbi:MAG: hypothetical protein WC967_16005 [Balneolaceae bacterium]
MTVGNCKAGAINNDTSRIFTVASVLPGAKLPDQSLTPPTSGTGKIIEANAYNNGSNPVIRGVQQSTGGNENGVGEINTFKTDHFQSVPVGSGWDMTTGKPEWQTSGLHDFDDDDIGGGVYGKQDGPKTFDF